MVQMRDIHSAAMMVAQLVEWLAVNLAGSLAVQMVQMRDTHSAAMMVVQLVV